jgi:hypothetical protein
LRHRLYTLVNKALLLATCLANGMPANPQPSRGGRHNVRLSQVATEDLTAWIEANQAHPYPTNNDRAMPPFLIGQPDISPFYTSLMRHEPNRPRVDCQGEETIWVSLVDTLQKLVRQSSSQQLMVSDRTLQSHARRTIYGSADSCGKTPADNPEWLDLCKRSYSISLLPDSTVNSHDNVAEDLEVYQDLGIRLPSTLQMTEWSYTLMKLFSSDGPLAKRYHRFSSVEIPLHLARAFEMIAMPWPDAGIVGDVVDMKEMLFLRSLDLVVNPPVFQLDFPRISIEEEEEEDDLCEACGPG